MRKIGIITIQHGINYGSVLQTFALYKKVQQLLQADYIEVINYVPDVDSFVRRYLYTDRNYSLVKKMVYFLVTMPGKASNQFKFNHFLKTHVKLSKRIHDIATAGKMYKDYDFLISGSDQVWNSYYNEGYDSMYYLAFADKKTKRIAYAVSCGKNEFDEDEWKECEKEICEFNYLSTREIGFCNYIKNKGFLNCMTVLDPIFLLSMEEWKEYMKRVACVPEHYVFVFSIGKIPDEMIKAAKKIAEEKKLKILSLEFGHIWTKAVGDFSLKNKTPNEFIWLIANADFVVTNSFHGTAFSIHFRKQFFSFSRIFNCRLESILGLFGLESRLMNGGNSLPLLADINYDYIKEIEQKLICNSIEYLQNCFD